MQPSTPTNPATLPAIPETPSKRPHSDIESEESSAKRQHLSAERQQSADKNGTRINLENRLVEADQEPLPTINSETTTQQNAINAILAAGPSRFEAQMQPGYSVNRCLFAAPSAEDLKKMDELFEKQKEAEQNRLDGFDIIGVVARGTGGITR